MLAVASAVATEAAALQESWALSLAGSWLGSTREIDGANSNKLRASGRAQGV